MENAAVNSDLELDDAPERTRCCVLQPIPVCMEIVLNTLPSRFTYLEQSAARRIGRIGNPLRVFKYIPVELRANRKFAL